MCIYRGGRGPCVGVWVLTVVPHGDRIGQHHMVITAMLYRSGGGGQTPVKHLSPTINLNKKDLSFPVSFSITSLLLEPP